MTAKIFFWIALCTTGLAFASGSNSVWSAESTGGHNHEEHGSAGVKLSDQSLKALDGEILVAGPAVLRRRVTIPGEVKLNEEGVAQVGPRYPAQVIEVRARIGDRVKAGDTLAMVESSQSLQPFALKAPIDGTLIDRSIVLGEQLQPKDTAFVVADLSTLWVDIALYPEQIPQVRIGQEVRLTSSFGPDPVRARIDYLGPRVDEHLRTGLARIFLDNRSRAWKPGMFVEAEVTLEKIEAPIVVPHAAVIQYEDQKVVFVKEDERWHPRPVSLGKADREGVAILSGLRAGEAYVARGGFILKADLLKSEFESGHSH